jgi:ribosome maturation factor RimP
MMNFVNSIGIYTFAARKKGCFALGDTSPLFYYERMISTKQISSIVEAGLKDTDIFLVEAEVRTGNHIRVFIDSPGGVTIEECMNVSRIVESGLNREIEDFELEVSSPGLNSPLKVFPQYLKNIGREVEVIKNDGIKFSGKLIQIDKQGIVLEVRENKRETLSFSDIKSTRVQIIF